MNVIVMASFLSVSASDVIAVSISECVNVISSSLELSIRELSMSPCIGKTARDALKSGSAEFFRISHLEGFPGLI